MNVDTKNPLLKSSIGENRLTQKDVKSSIDQSSVESAAQKSLNMDLKKKSEETLDSKKKKDKDKDKDKKKDDLSLTVSSRNEEVKIERDPLKLLKLL